MARAGEIVTRDELMREVWQTTFYTSSKTIDVHLGLAAPQARRRPAQPDPDHHASVGAGLRFEADATPRRRLTRRAC